MKQYAGSIRGGSWNGSQAQARARRWCGRRLLLATLAAACGLPAQAQRAPELADLPLGALLDLEISGASRFVTRRSESAAAVTVITRDEIRALGHRTLADVLRGVRGLMLASDRIYDYVGVRGFYAAGDYNTRVLLLIDGNRVNDALYDQAFIGTDFPLDLAAVERVEFVPGQGSAVYGGNALFGVVNVITRAAVLHAQQSVTLGVGSLRERLLRGTWSRPTADGGWQLMVSRTLDAGATVPDIAPGAPPRVAVDADETRRSALYARWDHGPWQASVVHGDREKAVPLGQGVIFGDPRNRYRDRMTLLSVQHARALGATEHGALRLFAGHYRFVGDFAIDYPPPTHNVDVATGRWHGVEARVTSTRLPGHRLVAGLDWQQASTLDQQNFDVAPEPAQYLDSRRRRQRVAVFAEDQWSLGERLTLHLGARVDQIQAAGRSASPRVAVSWRPAPAWALKAIHGRAFRAPNAYEAYYEVDAPAGYLRNPDLQTERVIGDELSAEWQPRADWRIGASLYRNRARRLLLLNYDALADRYQYANAGSFAAHGLELEVEHARGAQRWRLNATFNHDSSALGALGADRPTVFPRRMLKGAGIVPLPAWDAGGAPWLLGLELDALGRRGASPGRALLHVALTAPALPGGGRASLAVRNVLGRAQTDPGADTIGQPVIPLTGRTWRLELEWPFGR